jgi:hypothetical protein
MGQGETYLVHAIRAIVVGHGRCPALLRLLDGLVADDAEDLARSLAILLGAIDNGCRRPVTIGYRGDATLTPNEIQIVAIIAAAQRGDSAELSARLNWLVSAPHQKPVAIAARIVARLLAAHGAMLCPSQRAELPVMYSVA